MIPVHPGASDFLENTQYTLSCDLLPHTHSSPRHSPLLRSNVYILLGKQKNLFFTINLLYVIFSIYSKGQKLEDTLSLLG